MIFPLFRRGARQNTISTLYGTIVAQARLPCFYCEYAVPDTVFGRFELLVMHLALVLNRLAEEPEIRDLGQSLFDHFCKDMDHNLRELGVGDLAVPKQMQRMGEAFYGRAQAYRKALGATDKEALIEAVKRNIYDNAAPGGNAAARLAAYMREAVRDLEGQSASTFLSGKIPLPNPSVTVLVEDQG
jgi:cytochrome b pre-mRNA-processing protein 3